MENNAADRFRRGIYTDQCVRLMLDAWQKRENKGEGVLVTYKDLQKAMGMDPQGPGRSYLSSAMRILLNSYGMVCRARRNEGIWILSDAEKPAVVVMETIESLRNRSNKGIKELSTVSEFDELPDAEKVRHNIGLSFLGAINHMTKPKQIKRLESKVGETILGFQDTLRLFEG